MATQVPIGSNGGGFIGFTLGAEPNSFSTNTRSEALALVTTQSNDADWLAGYDGEELYIELLYSMDGSSIVEYLKYTKDNWRVIQNVQGVAGRDGQGTDFSSVPPMHIPYIDSNGHPQSSGMTVEGRKIVTEGSYQAGPSSIYLGPNFRVSNGMKAVTFKLGTGEDALGLNVRYDENGTKLPRLPFLGPRVSLTVNSLYDSVMADPLDVQYQTVGTNLTYNFNVRPSETGTLRVRFWAGTGMDGTLLFDESLDVTQEDLDMIESMDQQGQIGQIEFDIGNQYILEQDTDIFVRFSGIKLEGGTPTSGPFAGIPLPYFVSKVQSYEEYAPATSGFFNFYDSTPNNYVLIYSNTWNRVQCDGAGNETDDAYGPIGVHQPFSANSSGLLEVDISELNIGDMITIRVKATARPWSNRQKPEMRISIGSGFDLHYLVKELPSMDDGAWQEYNLDAEFIIPITNNSVQQSLLIPEIKSSGYFQLRDVSASLFVVQRGY